jgi:hypothetical protein
LSGWKDWQIGEVVEAAEFQTFLQDQVVQVYADSSARGSALGTAVAEGMVSFTADNNAVEVYNGTDWVGLEASIVGGTAGQFVQSAGTAGIQYADGFLLRETVYFTSSGTFTKASYPWLRAIRVRCQGGGGAGGGADATSAGQGSGGAGGSGGNYSESFITDIAGLDASVTVTRGAGGSGVAGAAGNAGASSSFGTLVVAAGGLGASRSLANALTRHLNGRPAPAAGPTGDLQIQGAGGQSFYFSAFDFVRGTSAAGGSSHLGGGGNGLGSSGDGANGSQFGGGGGGALNAESQATARVGGNGADGIVILELYA